MAAVPPARHTRQLLLRAHQPRDVDALYAIQGDADAMRFTHGSASRADTADWCARYAQRGALDGFAPWIALLRESGRVVGWGGLNRDPAAPHWGVEVAYFFDRAYWGRGLATELVQASLDHAFRDLGLDHVGAFVRPENRASVRVLVKTGFTRLHYVAELERDAYRRTSGTRLAG